MRNVIYVTVFALSACTSWPDTVGECANEYRTPTEIEFCEQRVVEIEDQKHRRKMEKQRDEQMARMCWEAGQVYNANTGQCKYWEML